MGKLIDLTHSTLDGVIENPRPLTEVWMSCLPSFAETLA